MEGFLDQVAADLRGRYGADISRRARLFFGEAMAAIIPEPVWQPVAVSVDGLAEELSGMAVGDLLSNLIVSRGTVVVSGALPTANLRNVCETTVMIRQKLTGTLSSNHDMAL